MELYDYGDGDPYSVRARRLPNEDEAERRDDYRFDVDPKAEGGAIGVGVLCGLAVFNPVHLLTGGSLA